MKHILIIEDDKSIAELEKDYLEINGFSCTIAARGTNGLELALSEDFDLVIIDVMLPGMDGFEVIASLRKKKQTPVIFLSAKSDDISKIKGLGLGADDYMTKPFSIRELTARVKANLRRMSIDMAQSPSDPFNTIISGDLAINTERYEVQKRGKIIDITLREFELLKFLAQQPDKIFTRESLLENVWGYEYYGDVRTVDVTVRRLREKIEDDASLPKYIMTKRGVGYYFNKA